MILMAMRYGSLQSVFFTTSDALDSDNPVTVFVTPPDGATDVGVNAAIRVRFDEPINPLTVNESTIMVTDGTNSAVSCTISFSNENQDVLMTPHAPFGG